jgi:ferredoxin-NADP reductase
MRIRYLVGPRRDYPINARTLQKVVPDIAGADVYVCGPIALVEAVRDACAVLGIPDERVHDEAFSFHSPDTYAFERRLQESR